MRKVRNDRVGESTINNQGLKMTIIKYNKSNDIDVEFERSTADIPILIEDSFENAVKGNYRSQVTPKAFLGALFSFCDENDTFFYFMEDKRHSALWIYDMLKYRVRNKLKDL